MRSSDDAFFCLSAAAVSLLAATAADCSAASFERTCLGMEERADRGSERALASERPRAAARAASAASF